MTVLAQADVDLPLWVDVFRVLVAFLVFLLTTAVLIWAERRVVSMMQSRVGPNRVGPLGIGQTLVDGLKMFFKEDVTPSMVDRIIFTTAPLVAVVVSFLTVAVIPVGGVMEIANTTFVLQAADLNVGVLWILAMGSLHVYAVFLAGWSSASPYPLMGGIRASAQMISYEIAQGLAIASVLIYTGSLRISDIVAGQSGEGLFTGAPAWYFLPLFPAFAVFVVGMIAETQRPPFDLAEAEGELVAGFHTEYSGMRFGMFMLSEFMGVVIMSAVVVTLFFGGPGGPVFGPQWLANLLPIAWFMGKTVGFIFFFILLRGALPRARYDKLMAMGWKVMIPVGLVWTIATAALVVAGGNQGADPTVAGLVGLGLMLVAIVLFRVIARDDRVRTTLATSTARPIDDANRLVPVTPGIPASGSAEVRSATDSDRKAIG